MNIAAPLTTNPASAYAQKVFVLQGGGALGSYQAGAFEALREQNIEPDWIAGISIGAINAAIMAGNVPGERLEKLRSFWNKVSVQMPVDLLMEKQRSTNPFYRTVSSWWVSTFGVPGFFSPWQIPSWFQARGSAGATSIYDTEQLRQTLLDHVDFDRINHGPVRLSLGAVNVRTGNFAFFDNRDVQIKPEHVMASGALPPGFPAIKIGSEYYWDGGLVSNTPLTYVLRNGADVDTVVFQVDLFSAAGPQPQDLEEVEERRKDITYSSRTRLNTDLFLERHRLRRTISELYARLPEEAKADPAIQKLKAQCSDYGVTIIHLIYRNKQFRSHSKDYEFSALSMHEHWETGLRDARKALLAEDWRVPPNAEDGLKVYDIDQRTRSRRHSV
ncbi:patatin-like phospholipase family protein [Agrobacterium rhizogenes]|uniref:patatin-like phospholipase family protein n=1 Tax=Rhizobium rhizogenes TaxID=359 RepID=UPI001573D63A|nr:patatin-like phospholipase family protein [Rhizobium rhizogenes]NTF85555.1 patatin-like phospholipase family protein [Rhizobium rhizogenes]NTG50200.1 patatin-like phospholipase family protein [Rhizobium rhizogenes]NTI14107.1 patatin-like phospholipase family protein [Rhizobium rhizogenes]